MCRRNADSLSHTFAATPDFLIPTQLKTRFIFQMLHYLVLGSSTTKFLSSNVGNKIKVKVIKIDRCCWDLLRHKRLRPSAGGSHWEVARFSI